ncbi:hypothetical protein [Sinorhizobium mexicanum]|nr:hypothetical protein [Sinorhizobium mexicanum]MBP1884894.1 hypothetical protein [Sinorhizobium mexicanum]
MTSLCEVLERIAIDAGEAILGVSRAKVSCKGMRGPSSLKN